MLTAVAQPLPAPRLLTQPTTPVPLQQLVPLHPLNPLVQQVGFHIAFVADFLDDRRGALRARICDPRRAHSRHPQRNPGAGRRRPSPADLRADRIGGRPRTGRLRREVCQLPAQFPGESGDNARRRRWRVSYIASRRPDTGGRGTGARRTQRIGGRAPDKAVNVARADRSDNSRRVTTTSTSSKTDTSTQQPKKFRLTVAESESVTSTTARLTTRTPTPLRQTKPMSTQRRQRRTAGPM